MRFNVYLLAAAFIVQPMTNAVAAEPGGTDGDARLAIQSPDQYAWKLFLWVNREAKSDSAGEADNSKPTIKQYSDNHDVVWETWALESRDARPEAEVYLAGGAMPAAWAALPRQGNAPKKLDRTGTNIHNQLLQALRIRTGATAPQLVIEEPESDEVRINKSGFEFIRDHGLYSREGLAAAFSAAVGNHDRDAIQFPAAAKEVKARWDEIDESQKSRYHWRKIDNKIYGLKAFHIITKDLPMWFWTDFIHVDLESAEPDPCTDSTTRGRGASDGENGIRRETVGSKWENYRLKGTQVSLIDQRGRPTILGNQLIEFGNAKVSSCMTCHAGAGVSSNGAPNVFGFITGAPPTTVFGEGSTINVIQTDFLYSMVLRAHSHNEGPPRSIFAARQAVEGKQTPTSIEGFPNHIAGRLALRRATLTSPTHHPSAAPQFVIVQKLKRWDAGSAVTVAFRGGTTDLHRKISDASKDWTNQGNIKLDFGFDAATGQYRHWSPNDASYKAQVRISFDQIGYWSLVGRDSIDPGLAGPGEASLNLAEFDQAMPSDWRGIALHELGHALGFEHEHQSPEGHCDDEFRWDDDLGYVATKDSFGQFVMDSQGRRPGLYAYLGGPPNNWSLDTVNFNLRQLSNSSAFVTSEFDRKSIMKYFFPDWMFKKGTNSPCYSPHENLELSQRDIQGIKVLYPQHPAEIGRLKNERAELLNQLRGMKILPEKHLEQLK